MPAKSKRIAHCIANLFFYRRTDRIIQITLFIRLHCSNSLMNKTIFQRFHAGHEFHAAGCSKKMSDHGFCGVYDQIFCSITKCLMNSPGFKQIIVMGACSVCIDVFHLGRLHTSFFHCKFHRSGCSCSILCR